MANKLLLEKILVLETIEKIIRMQLFLLKASINATESDLKVIKIYQSTTKKLLKDIDEVNKMLRDDYGTLNESEKFSCMKRISDVFNSIDELHLYLSFIHGEWTAPETYIFVNDLFKTIIKEKQKEKKDVPSLTVNL